MIWDEMSVVTARVFFFFFFKAKAFNEDELILAVAAMH